MLEKLKSKKVIAAALVLIAVLIETFTGFTVSDSILDTITNAVSTEQAAPVAVEAQ